MSRAGYKLEKALQVFGIDPTGRRCLDAGSSTGGFTDCLLQHGADRVFAVDVGTGQLHARLRENPKVEVYEKTDIRAVSLEFLGLKKEQRFDLVVADLSFIATSRLLPVLGDLLAEDGEMVTLVKPQFEAGRAEVSRGRGVIKDPLVWVEVLHRFIDAAAAAGVPVVDLDISPVKGGKGNVEFLAHHRPLPARPSDTDPVSSQAGATADTSER